MILAHHGAHNGFTNDKLIKALKPSLAICSSNYGSTYDHPRQEVKDILHSNGVRLMTTKTGDIIVSSEGNHTGKFQATNLRSNSAEISSKQSFSAKKAKLLSFNEDTTRQLYSPTPAYRRLPRRR
jgi:competence protein ComEC